MMAQESGSRTFTPWRAGFMLSALYLLTAGWNLHIQTISNPDEPRYAVPARIMAQGGDWLVPDFNARPRLEKPAFFYWLIAVTGKAAVALGLPMDKGFRMGPLLMGWLGVLGTFWLGLRLMSLRAGVIAAVVLMTARLYHEHARDLVVDMTLTAAFVWAWLCAHIALEKIRGQQPGRFLPLLVFYLALGVACLTKGPVLVGLFVVLPLALYLAVQKRLNDLLFAGLWWGVPLALLPGVWWTWELWHTGYEQHVRRFYLMENVGRLTGAKDHAEPLPFWFYIRSMGDYFAPWWLAVPPAVAWSVMNHRAPLPKGAKPLDRWFVLLAMLVPFIVLGLAVTKRNLYLLPLYPWFALCLAFVCERAFLAHEGERAPTVRGVLWFVAVAVLAVCVMGAVLRERWDPTDVCLLWMGVTGGLSMLGLVLAGYNAGAGRRGQAAMQALAVAALFTIGFEAVYRPHSERREGRVEFYRELDVELRGRPVVFLGDSSNEAVWYLNRPKNEPVDNLRYPDLKAKFFEKPGTVLALREYEVLKKRPILLEALTVEKRILKGGHDMWLVCVPNGKTPDPKCFERAKPGVRILDSDGDGEPDTLENQNADGK